MSQMRNVSGPCKRLLMGEADAAFCWFLATRSHRAPRRSGRAAQSSIKRDVVEALHVCLRDWRW